MKIYRPLIPIIVSAILIFMVSCNTKTKTDIKRDSIKAAKQALLNKLKTLDDLKMALLEAKLDKATDLLGQPDDKGDNAYGSLGHYIYYDKVNDGGDVRHLLIFWKYDNSYKTIIRVEAVHNACSVRLGAYGEIEVKRPKGFEDEYTQIHSKANR